MTVEIKIPVPDQTTEEVRIVSWKKQEGESVSRDEVILEVETDKSVIEVEAVGDGLILKQLVKVDDMVPVGAVVGYIGQENEAIPDKAESPASDSTADAATAEKAAAEPAGESAAAADANELKIPVPDQTTEEVRIVNWCKNEGEQVNEGDTVLEVETDKSVIEVEAMNSGILLKQLVKVDDMVPVSAVVGYIGKAGAEVPASAPAEPTEAPSAPPIQTGQAGGGSVKATPIAEKIADKLGVDLATVSGSGIGGKITREDVERSAGAPAAASGGNGGRIFVSPNARRLAAELGVDVGLVRGSGPKGRILGKDIEAFAATMPKAGAGGFTAAPAPGQPQPGTTVEMSKMRRAIGNNLQMSFRDTPHFFVTMSIEMSKAMEVRRQLNESRPKERRISVNDLVLRAVALALKRYPAVNSRTDGRQIEFLADINIGVATALETGLVVPVLTNADRRDWDELAMEAKRLAGEARNGKIIGAGKGTFTVSNLGMFGVDNFTAIINPPESAILAVGGIKNEVIDIGGGIGVRPMMKVTLCSDHRIIDGAVAAQFVKAVKDYLEEHISV